jgi:DNA-binding transcriptional ArsR family regulator
MMLDELFGNRTAERVMLYLANYRHGYARDIAMTFDTSPSMVQKQLLRLERGSILVSRFVGKTRVFEFNPRWYFVNELLALLQKALAAMPEEENRKYYRKRLRPRRIGKPLWAK